MKAMEIAERLRELWDERENIHAKIIDLAQDVEMYGTLGEDERETLLRLKYESEEMTEALTDLYGKAVN